MKTTNVQLQKDHGAAYFRTENLFTKVEMVPEHIYSDGSVTVECFSVPYNVDAYLVREYEEYDPAYCPVHEGVIVHLQNGKEVEDLSFSFFKGCEDSEDLQSVSKFHQMVNTIKAKYPFCI